MEWYPEPRSLYLFYFMSCQRKSWFLLSMTLREFIDGAFSFCITACKKDDQTWGLYLLEHIKRSVLCCTFFPSLLWWVFFSAYIQPNPLQLPSFRRPVTDSVGRVARLVLIKHKYLLRVWAWSTFMKWWATFPYWHLHPMPHCEKLMPQIQLSLHFAAKGRQL